MERTDDEEGTTGQPPVIQDQDVQLGDRRLGCRSHLRGRDATDHASAVMRFTRQGEPGKAWLAGIKERKRPKVAAVAQANKTARIAWAILRRNEVFVARSA